MSRRSGKARWRRAIDIGEGGGYTKEDEAEAEAAGTAACFGRLATALFHPLGSRAVGAVISYIFIYSLDDISGE